MKRVLSMLLVITVLLGVYPIAFAEPLAQGGINAYGSIKGTSGYVEVELKLPEENVLIRGIEFSYTLPSGVALNGKPTTSLGGAWKIEQKPSGVFIFNENLEPLNNATATYGDIYTIAKIPLKIVANIAPGQLPLKITLDSVAVGATANANDISEGLEYFTKSADADIDYVKSISGAAVSGIKQQTYTGSQRRQYDIVVKLGGRILDEGSDYRLEYKNNIYPGEATVTVKGTGNYSGAISKSFIIIPDKISGLKKSTSTINSIKLTWNKEAGVSGYYIYRSLKSKSGYEKVKTTTSNSFTDKNLYSGKYYYYRVYAYKKVGSKAYTGKYAAASAKTLGYLVAKPSGLKVSKESGSSLKLSWKVTSKANGYIIYRSTKKDSGFKAVKTLTSPYDNYFTNKKLSAGKTYYYRVSAYRTYGGKKGIGAPAVITAATKPKAVSIKSVTSKKKYAKVTAKKLSGADGYYIAYSTKKGSGYKKLYEGTKYTYTKKNLKVGKTYYFKVRAYKKSGGKKLYGSYGKVKSVKIKK